LRHILPLHHTLHIVLVRIIYTIDGMVSECFCFKDNELTLGGRGGKVGSWVLEGTHNKKLLGEILHWVLTYSY
jgi:hypothetical protein